MESYLSVLPLLLVMCLAGVLGGVINYCLTPKEEKQNVWESIIIGVGASLMVPLFLNMISSNLLDVIRGQPPTVPGDTSKLLVFSGFCLVAAISSRAFIRTLSDRVLNEAKEAKQEARKAEETVKEIRTEIETDVSPALANLELFQEATSHVERGLFFCGSE
jgi:YLATT-like protein